jgi:hypothetical protein
MHQVGQVGGRHSSELPVGTVPQSEITHSGGIENSYHLPRVTSDDRPYDRALALVITRDGLTGRASSTQSCGDGGDDGGPDETSLGSAGDGGWRGRDVGGSGVVGVGRANGTTECDTSSTHDRHDGAGESCGCSR